VWAALRVFSEIDLDGNGFISKNEFADFCIKNSRIGYNLYWKESYNSQQFSQTGFDPVDFYTLANSSD